jgi:hypothetical protein
VFFALLAVVVWFLFLGALFWGDGCSSKKKKTHHRHHYGSGIDLSRQAEFDVKVTNENQVLIKVQTVHAKSEDRQVVRVTINGSECENDNKFDCSGAGISEVYNVALPKKNDELGLTVRELDTRIDLIEFTAPDKGTIFRIGHTVTQGLFSVDIETAPGIVFEGKVEIDTGRSTTIKSANAQVVKAN